MRWIWIPKGNFSGVIYNTYFLSGWVTICFYLFFYFVCTLFILVAYISCMLFKWRGIQTIFLHTVPARGVLGEHAFCALNLKFLIIFQHLLFRSLGLNLALADPPENDRLQILNEAWKVITKLKNPQVSYWRLFHYWSFAQGKTVAIVQQAVYFDGMVYVF